VLLNLIHVILHPVVQEQSVLSPDQAMLSADVNLVSSPIQTPFLDVNLNVSLTLIVRVGIFVRARDVWSSQIHVIHHHVDLELCVLSTLEVTPSVGVSQD